MKKLLFALVTLAVATAFTAPAFASVLNAKDKAECQKAGGVWVEFNPQMRGQETVKDTKRPPQSAAPLAHATFPH